VINLIVVDNPKKWTLRIPAAPIVAARAYIGDPDLSALRNVRVFNLCRSYRYQSVGYYVSLLAMARGHRPIPSITTIQDLKATTLTRVVAGDLDPLIQRSLQTIRSDRFTLSIYFGQNLAQRHHELSSRLFALFQAPLLRAEFRQGGDGWTLDTVRAIAASEIPANHQDFVAEAAARYFSRRSHPRRRRVPTAYDLAILADVQDALAPSDPRALRRFIRAARELGIAAELIRRDDYGHIAEFDGLFIRATTNVNHYTYRFARRAAAEGLVVVDHPDAIVKCSNKVYLAELLAHHGVPTPPTLIVHRDNRDSVIDRIGLPCILKQPDSAFSQGVIRADTPAELASRLDALLEQSDLVIAQGFMPTDFDWRIGILDRELLFACKYHMVPHHWQIARRGTRGVRYGRVEAVAASDVPRSVLRCALRAGRLIGDGLFGVDVKQVGRSVAVIEINDNPNIDAGCEDALLGDALYQQIMRSFRNRMEARRNGGARTKE
jgi:glutathione synthase/RimK-type ligase-like ATP-grasp enzyme